MFIKSKQRKAWPSLLWKGVATKWAFEGQDPEISYPTQSLELYSHSSILKIIRWGSKAWQNHRNPRKMELQGADEAMKSNPNSKAGIQIKADLTEGCLILSNGRGSPVIRHLIWGILKGQQILVENCSGVSVVAEFYTQPTLS